MMNTGPGAEDLATLLEPVADNQERLRLLRRLTDTLGLDQ